MSRKLFLTGANGFVGSNVLHYVLDSTDWDIVCPTTSLHHGTQDRLNGILNHTGAYDRVQVVRCDLSQPFTHALFGGEKPDYVWNIASESHVDRSLVEPVPFVENNVRLILNVLEYAREVEPRVVMQMSTDEVFGPAPEGYSHHEWDKIKPSNPYSASKAAQEAIAYSYWRAFQLPLILTNTMNLIAPGPGYQSAEKFVPKVIKKLMNDEVVEIHSTPDGKSGSRCWIDVRDFADAWLFLTNELEDSSTLRYYPEMPEEPHRFNIVGPEAANDEVAIKLGKFLRPDTAYHNQFRYVNFHESRPGHDPRYSLDGSKLEKLGWVPLRTLDDTLGDIVDWYLKNPETLEE